MAKITVLENEVTILKIQDEDYISLTDMLKSKDGDFFISDWLRNRNTIEYLGVGEKIHNPNFNYGEFATITSKAGLNSYKLSAIKENLIPKELTPQQINYIYASEADILNMALFGMTAKQWRESNKNKKGNIRDEANVNQLVCLSNLESLNAHFINEGLSQSQRLQKLNSITISQLKILSNQNTKQLSIK